MPIAEQFSLLSTSLLDRCRAVNRHPSLLLTLDELASAIGIMPHTLATWMSQSRATSIHTLMKIEAWVEAREQAQQHTATGVEG